MSKDLIHQVEPCNFCHEVNLARENIGIHYAETETAVALPTLGCFSIGYSLIVPKSHFTSFASIAPDNIRSIELFAEKIRIVSEKWLGPTIIAEHGTGAPEEPTAACCDHAHLHIIPTKYISKIVQIYKDRGG